LEIIKLYKNRFKYGSKDDWVNVVKSTINRRVGDFRVRMLRQNERFITENRKTTDDKEYRVDDVGENKTESDDNKRILQSVIEIIRSGEEYDEFDEELLMEIISLHNQNKEATDANLLYYLGYEMEWANEPEGSEKKKFITEVLRKIRNFREKMVTLKEKML